SSGEFLGVYADEVRTELRSPRYDLVVNRCGSFSVLHDGPGGGSGASNDTSAKPRRPPSRVVRIQRVWCSPVSTATSPITTEHQDQRHQGGLRRRSALCWAVRSRTAQCPGEQRSTSLKRRLGPANSSSHALTLLDAKVNKLPKTRPVAKPLPLA